EVEGGEPIEASLRALTFAHTLAAGLGPAPLRAVVFGPCKPAPLAAYGATEAVSVELPGYAPVAWARTLKEITDSLQAMAVVAAGSDRGAEVMANLGGLSGLPMAANCLEIAATAADAWRFRRQRWGGSLIETGVLEGTPALLTVATDSVTPATVDVPAELVVEPLVPALLETDMAVCAVEAPQSGGGGVSLANARVVVSGGRGVGGPEGYAVLEELAELLGGAVGVSRVATSLGWRPHSQQVGQTGTRVSPDLYLACGISGAIQHLAGCQSAKTMVAVNIDPAAAIMGRADYAVIGDLHEVLPALVAALRARAAARS
ncbi:MAG TPA: electron transfer flavoprotein subunit alpha/FixB family protein, partial [Acidimicrobiales bacterium]|nr:electron transfer flavoprotein subunit alpha/FixB family protein [Acidimicrobiales bacterium]